MAPRFNAVTGRMEDDDPTGLPGLSAMPLAGTSPAAGTAPPNLIDTTQTSTTTSTGGRTAGGSRTTIVPTEKALAYDAALADPVEGLAAKELAIGEKERQRAQALAEQRAATIARDEAERLDAQKKHIAAMEAERAKDEAALAKYQDQKPSDYWADKGAGEKFLAGLGVALGAIGSGLTGRSNTALEVLNRREQEHYNREQARIEKEWKTYGARTGLRAQADKIAEEKLRDLDAQRLAKAKWEQSQVELQLGKTGLSEADIAKDVRFLKAGEKVNRILAEQEEKRAGRVSSSWSSQQPETRTTTTTLTGTKPGAAGAAGDKAADRQDKDAALTVKLLDGNTLRAPDEKTAQTVRAKLEAATKLKQLTARLSADNAPAFYDKNRQQWDIDRREFVTNLAIMNNNDGKPSDSDVRVADQSTPDSWSLLTAKKFGILGQRASEKVDAIGTSTWGNRDAAAALRRHVDAAASAPGAATEVDAAAVQWARAHPDDPKAQTILRLNGGK